MPTSDRGTLTALAMSMVAAAAPLARRLPLASVRASLADRAARAGWPGGLDEDELLATGLLIGTILALGAAAIAAPVNAAAAPAAVSLIAAGPGLASAFLAACAGRRMRSISRSLPFVLDLLVLIMRAGASLTIAIERVAADQARHPVGAEFRALLRDLEHGSTLRESLERLAGRVPLDDVRAVVDELIEADTLGRPLADALARQAAESRDRRIRRAVDVAGRAKVKVLVPGMLILVACLVVLFAPFIVRFVHGGYAGS